MSELFVKLTPDVCLFHLRYRFAYNVHPPVFSEKLKKKEIFVSVILG